MEAVNLYQIEKAIVIADDISFLCRCPTLRWLWVQPSNSAPDCFDFSPLYQLPQLCYLRCETVYGEKMNRSGLVDYTQLPHLNRVAIHAEQGHIHFETLPALQELDVSNIKSRKTAGEYFSGDSIRKMSYLSCGIESLEGLETCRALESLSLAYNRNLEDISAVAHTATTLKVLDIENCAKISSFDCLRSFVNLEVLRLMGSNTLPDLRFLQYMTKLKVFSFSMNVLDGDLSMCAKIPYVSSERNRKHYNRKDKDLPKNLAPIRSIHKT